MFYFNLYRLILNNYYERNNNNNNVLLLILCYLKILKHHLDIIIFVYLMRIKIKFIDLPV